MSHPRLCCWCCLSRLEPGEGEEDLRGFEWHAYRELCAGDDLRTLTGHRAAVVGLAPVVRLDTLHLASAGTFGAQQVISKPLTACCASTG